MRTLRRRARTLAPVVTLLALQACGREPILHGLDERQASQVLAALDGAGVACAQRRDEGTEGAFLVEVSAADAVRARRILAERGLPRPEGAGFASVLGKGSIVPSPTEERARLLQAIAGELSRSVETLDGVVEARVHLALPPDDPLRAGPAPPLRGAVLVKLRPGARARVEPLAPGIRSLVAGAVAGLDPAQVAVVLAEAEPGAPLPAAAPAGRARIALAAAAAALALVLLAPRLRRLPSPWPRPGRSP